MATAKSMLDANRKRQRQTEDEEYLGPPPPNRDLIQTRLVIPGKDMLPDGLHAPGALDDIRKTHKAYITFPEPNILDIQCKYISQMKQAVHAVNWAIHDMRLCNDNPATKFFVQEPTKSDTSGMVKVVIGSRPHFTSHLPMPKGNSTALNEHFLRLTAEMTTSAEALMGLNKQMKMRVYFGHLNVRSRKAGRGDDIPYDEFVKLMGMYSARGGARLQSKLPEASQAEEVVRYLIDPKEGVCNGIGDLMRGCEATLTVQGQEIKADSMESLHQKTQLSMVRATKPDVGDRLNWTVVAPDMQYDWNLRVDTWENVDTPARFKDLSKNLVLIDDEQWKGILKVPSLNTSKLRELQAEVGRTSLKSSVIIPYKTTPYVIEVSVTKTWERACTLDKPETTWGVELYASHWDESINHVCGGERRKDWGQGLKNIWPGDEPSLEPRFEGFLRTILEVQALLEGAQSSNASGSWLLDATSSCQTLI